MIGDVEKLRSKLKLVLLVDLEVLHHGHIEIDQIGPTQRASTGIAKLSGDFLSRSERRQRERSRVEPALQRLHTAWAAQCLLSRDVEREVIWIMDEVRPGRCASGIGQ